MRISDWSSDVCSSDLMADAMNASGFAVIGTVDDAKAQIQRLIDQSGGFGTFLTMAQEWADRPAMWRSYELMSRYVFPEFQQSAISTEASRDWAAENRPEFIAAATSAVMNAVRSEEHTSELQSLMRISYAVLCLKKKNLNIQ